jgi:hypothetical protein
MIERRLRLEAAAETHPPMTTRCSIGSCCAAPVQAANSNLRAIRDMVRWVDQARVYRCVDLKACGLERRDRLSHVFFAFVNGALELFGSPRHTPRPDAARRANHCVGCGRSGDKIMAGDAIEDRCTLADKNLQDLPFEPAVAKRHPPEVLFVDDTEPAVRSAPEKVVRTHSRTLAMKLSLN